MNETVYGLKIFFFALQKRNMKWENKSRSAGSPLQFYTVFCGVYVTPLPLFIEFTLYKSPMNN